MQREKVKVLSGGAAQGLVSAVARRFKAETRCEIDGTFGAVGAMRDGLMSGAPADLLILTRALIEELVKQGHVAPDSVVDIGTVTTAVAIRSGDAVPKVDDAASLQATLLGADAIYFPDPKQATAGIHFARVLARLGIAGHVASRLKTFPNGATAMRELAAATSQRPIGCTQVTEILSTPGVDAVAPLPKGLELDTIYTAGVAARASMPREARELAMLLAGDAARDLRRRAGFA